MKALSIFETFLTIESNAEAQVKQKTNKPQPLDHH